MTLTPSAQSTTLTEYIDHPEENESPAASSSTREPENSGDVPVSDIDINDFEDDKDETFNEVLSESARASSEILVE